MTFLFGRRDGFAVETHCTKRRYGNPGAAWTYCPDLLEAGAVVYAFGVGEDLSFERALLERHDVRVHAFDFTPRSREWLSTQTMGAGFAFHPYGVAEHDGEETFFPPNDPTHVSHAIVPRGASTESGRRFPVKRVATIARELGHRRLGMLKLDIEGSEYGVLEDLLRSELVVDQILVEFHHRFAEIGLESTRRALATLKAHAYRVFAISPDRTEFSLRRL